MAAQSFAMTTEDRVKQWQRVVGWWDHENGAPKPLPFSTPGDPTSPLIAAEDEEADILVTHYVDSVLQEGWPPEAMSHDGAPYQSATVSDEAGDTEALLEKGTHALVFGYSGEGKSACRITTLREATRRGFLVAEYLSVGLERRDRQEHATAIAELIWTAIHATGWPVITEQAAQKTTPLQRLRSLIRLLVPHHCAGIFIFVDNVEDNLGPIWSMDGVVEAIEPFFDPQLIGLRGLTFKLFVPREIAPRVARYPVVNSGSKHRFRPLRLHWTKTSLRECLDDRLRDVIASEQQVFGTFTDDHTFDLVDQVVDAALSMSGAPRNLFALVHEMIISHVRQESDPTRHRLTLRDFERAKQHVFLARIQGEIDRQERQIQLRERQLDHARHTGDQQLIPQIAAWLVQLLQNTNALYHELLAWVQQGASVEPEIPERLQEVRSLLLRIEMRLEEVHAEATDIRSLVVHLRREIIETYDEGSRVVVDTLIETMTRFHMQNVHLAIRAINSARVSHDEIAQAFATIESALRSVHADVQGIDDELRDSLAKLDTEINKAPSIAHKLKLALPLLPFLAYEVELKRDLHDDLMKLVGMFRKADHTSKSAQHEEEATGK